MILCKITGCLGRGGLRSGAAANHSLIIIAKLAGLLEPLPS